MAFRIHVAIGGESESVIEDGSKGQKGKPFEWKSREAAEHYIADCKKYAWWTGGRHDISAEFRIEEISNEA